MKIRNVSLPKGTYVKLQPVTSDFLDITNPKAVLERTLRSYTCLTVGDCFVVNYNNKNYEIEVREAKPGNAISVVETDCQVDFEAPKDYKEPERVVKPPPKPKAEAAQGIHATNDHIMHHFWQTFIASLLADNIVQPCTMRSMQGCMSIVITA